MDNEITFITQNNQKANQIKDVFRSDFKYQILHIPLPDYQGSEEYIVGKKCKDAIKAGIKCPVVTDVTSVCFNALGGLPGPLISSFENKLTSEDLYYLLEGFDDKSAYILYTLGLLEDEDSPIQIFQHCLLGTVVKPRSRKVKGWEACFKPDQFRKTYSKLPANVQGDISERKKALRSLKTYLISQEFFEYF